MKDMPQTIGVIGFGRFGSFFSRKILPHIFPNAKISVFARSRKGSGFSDLKTVCLSDLVIPAVPIGKTEELCQQISNYLNKKTIVMDVCSVKSEPVRWMKTAFPKYTQIIASHPMFGTSTYSKFSGDLSRLKMVFYPTRCRNSNYQSIKKSFSDKMKVFEMDPDIHDRLAAKFQFTAHFLGQVLNKMDISPSRIDTESGSLMLDLMENLSSDTDELFIDMYRFNPYAKEQLSKILSSISEVAAKLK